MTSEEKDTSELGKSVVKKLGVIFPQHDPSQIKKIVMETEEFWEGCQATHYELMNVCSEKLAMTPLVEDRSERDAYGLSVLQNEVFKELVEMFPNIASDTVCKSVQHTTNQSDIKYTLLQNCIDDLLEGRTAYGLIENSLRVDSSDYEDLSFHDIDHKSASVDDSMTHEDSSFDDNDYKSDEDVLSGEDDEADDSTANLVLKLPDHFSIKEEEGVATPDDSAVKTKMDTEDVVITGVGKIPIYEVDALLADDSEPDRSQLYVKVRWLPRETSEAEVRNHFSRAGPIQKVGFLKQKQRGKVTKNAKVYFTDAISAQVAVTLFNRKKFKGRNIRVTLCHKQLTRQRANKNTGSVKQGIDDLKNVVNSTEQAVIKIKQEALGVDDAMKNTVAVGNRIQIVDNNDSFASGTKIKSEQYSDDNVKEHQDRIVEIKGNLVEVKSEKIEKTASATSGPDLMESDSLDSLPSLNGQNDNLFIDRTEQILNTSTTEKESDTKLLKTPDQIAGTRVSISLSDSGISTEDEGKNCNLLVSPIIKMCSDKSQSYMKQPPSIIVRGKVDSNEDTIDNEVAACLKSTYRKSILSDSDGTPSISPVSTDSNDSDLPEIKFIRRLRDDDAYKLLAKPKAEPANNKVGLHSDKPATATTATALGLNITKDEKEIMAVAGESSASKPSTSRSDFEPSSSWSTPSDDRTNWREPKSKSSSSKKELTEEIYQTSSIHKSKSQQTLTIKSTHKITYSQPNSSTASRNVNIQPPKILLSLTPDFSDEDYMDVTDDPVFAEPTSQPALLRVDETCNTLQQNKYNTMRCRGCGDCFDATTLASHQLKCKAQNRQEDDVWHSYRSPERRQGEIERLVFDNPDPDKTWCAVCRPSSDEFLHLKKAIKSCYATFHDEITRLGCSQLLFKTSREQYMKAFGEYLTTGYFFAPKFLIPWLENSAANAYEVPNDIFNHTFNERHLYGQVSTKNLKLDQSSKESGTPGSKHAFEIKNSTAVDRSETQQDKRKKTKGKPNPTIAPHVLKPARLPFSPQHDAHESRAPATQVRDPPPAAQTIVNPSAAQTIANPSAAQTIGNPSAAKARANPPATQEIAKPPAAQARAYPPATREIAKPPAAQARTNPPAALRLPKPPAAQEGANPPVAQAIAYPPAAQAIATPAHSKANPPAAKGMGVQPPAPPAVTRNRPPPARTKTNPPVAQAVANPPVAQAVANPPVAQAVANPPVAQAVANPPVAQAVGNPPVAQAVANPPVAQAVADPPVAQAVANQPAAIAGANPPVAQARANPPAGQARANPPAAQTKANPSSAKDRGVQPPALPAASKNPPTLAQARANPPSAQTRANPPVAQTIANPPVAHGRAVQPAAAVTRELPHASQAFAHPLAAEAAFQPPAQMLDPPEPNASSVEEIMTEVLSLFPDVDEAYLESLALQVAGPMAVNNICFYLLERQYPRKKRPETDSVETELVKETINYFIPAFKEMHDDTYYRNASALLLAEFAWFGARFIAKALETMKECYAPTYRFLAEIWKQIAIQTKLKDNVSSVKSKLSAMTFEVEIDQEISRPEAGSSTGTGKDKVKVTLLKFRRQLVKSSPQICPALQTEIDWVREKCKELEAEADREIAMGLNEEEYELQGQCIECGCCYGEFPFESMVQCCDGHLFCQGCLQQYARESVFGQGKADLKCMTDMCGSSFPKSQLVRALPREMLARYEDRVAEENLNLADLGDLVKCPHCEFRAFMDKSDKVFRCQNDKCMKETCRYCQVGWDEHFGKPCSEVEKRDETKLRLEYEEKMTKAKVRMCQRCKAQFTKEDGCNKMTCRCGATMCYICREPDINYKHFCQHPRDPGCACTSCKACSLWTNPEEDDNRAVAEIQRAAEEERKAKGFTDDKVIGVPDMQPPKKKMKV
ncbi:uncharacterized protein LOC127848315 isoform X3 [Dreissena polymorpha]|uniref:uncharacterized protein LOC127848315 isoform X3 n=1 Tax=Dreissena polymorpha TaxID=45954 RepID=UPI00226426B2|nr:uncharacterized protein LOC127848315 isoform X3 [Dreissena polymorpha]